MIHLNSLKQHTQPRSPYQKWLTCHFFPQPCPEWIQYQGHDVDICSILWLPFGIFFFLPPTSICASQHISVDLPHTRTTIKNLVCVLYPGADVSNANSSRQLSGAC